MAVRFEEVVFAAGVQSLRLFVSGLSLEGLNGVDQIHHNSDEHRGGKYLYRILVGDSLEKKDLKHKDEAARIILKYTGSFIKNEPISKRYFAVRKQRRGKSRMPLRRAQFNVSNSCQ
jgi:hypothetical protein